MAPDFALGTRNEDVDNFVVRRGTTMTDRRYLRYDEVRPVAAGMDHQLSNLRCLLAEAHAMGRLAVLPPLRLEARHNFGSAREWVWDSYFDLDASRLVGANGEEYKLPLVRELPCGILETHIVPPRGLWSATERAPLVIRQVQDELYRKEVPVRQPAPLLWLRPSATVLNLAAPVIASLLDRCPAGFAGVHIRRGDRLWGPMKWLMRPPNIRRRLKKLGIRDRAGVFFMSDEHDASFWAALAPSYDVVRYTDFPELVELVAASGGRTPDNYLLYEVEREVMRHAAKRVETFPIAGREPVIGTLVPTTTWIVARNVRKTWRVGKQFTRRCVRKAIKLATLVIRRLGDARPSSGG